MARSVCNATSIRCNWVDFAFSSSTYRAINVTNRSQVAGNFQRFLSASRLQRFQMSKCKQAEQNEEMPVLPGNRQPSGWTEEELRVVRQDLEGDGLSPRWVHEVMEEDVKLLTRFKSRYNLVQVLEVSRSAESPLAGSRVMTLDRPGNIHSIQFKFKVLTDSYYDAFASLPPLIPEGPIGILGLAAGTAARLVHHFWPGIEMHGWELDRSVVAVGRRYFGMLDLEAGEPSDLPHEIADEQEEYVNLLEHGKKNNTGKLIVHVGDALHKDATAEGGFAGILVDLFSEGRVISPLQQTSTWETMKERLKPGGRIMVNCGGSCVEAENLKDGNETMRETLNALIEAFPGEVSTRTFYPDDNCMAMTGPFPDITDWKRKLPRCLKVGVSNWRPTS